MNLQENGARFKGNSSSVFNTDNDDEKHHHELLRHSGRMKREKVEPTMKRIWKRSRRRHVTDDNSFLRQTLKRI
jgi:hypothetical protein